MHESGNNPDLRMSGSFKEESSLEDLFKEYYERLVYFAYQVIKDKDTAEDIVQETFIKFWNQRKNIEADGLAIKSYLYSTVKNNCLNILRHQKVEEKYKEKLGKVYSEEVGIVQLIIRAEVVSELHRALQTLPAGCRQISRLGYFEGKSNPEIAAELGISVNTVKTQKQRGLQLLRLRLDPEMFSLLLLSLLES